LLATAFAASAQSRVHWALVLPFQIQNDSTGANPQRMATEFYLGFKAAMDSVQYSGDPITLDVYDFDETSGQVVSLEADGLKSSLSPKEFMQSQEGQVLRYVIGPFRAEDSEALALHANPSTYVINPVSRDVSVSGLPQLIASAPKRYLESESLGRLAARDFSSRPNSRTVLFDLGDKNSQLQRRAFFKGFSQFGGDSNKVQIWDGRPNANLVERVGRDDLVSTRFVLLDDKVLSAARILQGLRQRPASQTEFWTVSNTVNSPSLDAFLLLRQPIVWVQTDRLEFATYDAVDEQIHQALGDSKSRWAWLGYDTALMLLANEPGRYTGPRRSYDWGSEPQGGAYNKAVELYRYDPKVGVNSVPIPVLP
ncbi:MAG: hypothetical protein K9I86_01135, partial [Cryomorphaceae bacterium]|nr:hypothetical protein [Cryomorphaceae bacterium]